MTTFKAKRVSHEYTQTNDAPPDEVFPLLCPVRESEWVPGWQYRGWRIHRVLCDVCVRVTPLSHPERGTW